MTDINDATQSAADIVKGLGKDALVGSVQTAAGLVIAVAALATVSTAMEKLKTRRARKSALKNPAV